MEVSKPSATAEGAAVVRALHQTLDDAPRILDDPVAPRLVEPESEIYRAVATFMGNQPGISAAQFRANFVMRSRYAEDCLAESLKDGVSQYVLLGAGFDTFPYRQPDWARSLRIFEVDYPASQEWKRARLASAGIPMPGNLHLVPVDFQRNTLREGLAAAALDFSLPTLFSSLGVTQYLTEDAFDAVLNFVLSLHKASQIVFSFVLSDDALSPEEAAFATVSATRTAAMGEPWLSRFLPEQLVRKLTGMGFSTVIHFSTDAANSRYFRGRHDGMSAHNLEQMMRAIV